MQFGVHNAMKGLHVNAQPGFAVVRIGTIVQGFCCIKRNFMKIFYPDKFFLNVFNETHHQPRSVLESLFHPSLRQRHTFRVNLSILLPASPKPQTINKRKILLRTSFYKILFLESAIGTMEVMLLPPT